MFVDMHAYKALDNHRFFLWRVASGYTVTTGYQLHAVTWLTPHG